ncbi:hypothetical protein [Bradyrhizobium sp. Leo121]|uniref:hypothetical protein n=1 Tax=Bradyrhizobium sp. Leo121 TaxID=1571195 RepID=UPI001FDFBB04|nr:hypothetical protein [Bradyrhizobium sp. Leo121]
MTKHMAFFKSICGCGSPDLGPYTVQHHRSETDFKGLISRFCVEASGVSRGNEIDVADFPQSGKSSLSTKSAGGTA